MGTETCKGSVSVRKVPERASSRSGLDENMARRLLTGLPGRIWSWGCPGRPGRILDRFCPGLVMLHRCSRDAAPAVVVALTWCTMFYSRDRLHDSPFVLHGAGIEPPKAPCPWGNPGACRFWAQWCEIGRAVSPTGGRRVVQTAVQDLDSTFMRRTLRLSLLGDPARDDAWEGDLIHGPRTTSDGRCTAAATTATAPDAGRPPARRSPAPSSDSDHGSPR